jgi:hypothetical protein
MEIIWSRIKKEHSLGGSFLASPKFRNFHFWSLNLFIFKNKIISSSKNGINSKNEHIIHNSKHYNKRIQNKRIIVIISA